MKAIEINCEWNTKLGFWILLFKQQFKASLEQFYISNPKNLLACGFSLLVYSGWVHTRVF